MLSRHENELAHNQKILNSADAVWGRLGVAGSLRVSRRAEMMIKQAGISTGTKVLEIGCGTGELTSYLATTGASIVATDLFEEFLQTARQKIQAVNVSFAAAAAEDLKNFTDNSFDVVCGLSILHHLDILPALANIHRVLRSGGRVVFSEPNMANPQIAIQKNVPIIKKWLGDSPDETAFFRGDIAKQFKLAGFSKVKVTPFDFLHPATPDFAAWLFDRAGRWAEKTPGLREIAGSLFIYAEK